MNNKKSIFLKPNQQLILFDGICNMCNSTVKFIMKFDSKKKFVFASLQGNTAKIIANEFNFDNTKLNSIILLNNGIIYNKSTAVLKIISKLKFPINLLSVFFIIPKPIRDYIYNAIKKNRYKWFGRSEKCYLPLNNEKKRFLP